MAFRQEDFKKTSRKSNGDAPASVYPHQLKDKKTLARLEIAIRTFDGAVGKRRRDMDAQAMTDFFGDPRLARGIVACLGQFYKYETLDFAQAVGRDAAARLGAAGLTRPVDVRADTYAWVNAHANGFLTEAARAEVYGELGGRFCLSAHQWDGLLHGDAEDNQVLARLGAMPTPADIVALYNFHALDTVLRRATTITLHGLALPAGDAADMRALAKSLGVRAVVSGDGGTVTLTEEAPPAPNSGGVREEGAGKKGAGGTGASPTPPELGAGGRSSPPELGAGGRSSAPPLLGAGGVIPFPLGRKPLDAGDVLARVDTATNSLFALPPAAPPAVPADVRALCDRAAREGLVRASDARRTLHLLDESPLIAWVRQCEDPRVRYVPGVGLCSREMVQDMAAAMRGEA